MQHRAARRSVAYGTAGAAGGVALAVLVLPAIANTARPTALASALLTVLLALATTTVQRLTDRRRQRSALADTLRTWPPELLAVADVSALGAYPGRGPDGHPEPYQLRPRAEDALLREALQRSDSVVIHGPPGIGKSRAAAEAARHALGDFPAIIPVNGDGLATLADDIDCYSRGLGRRVCIWLDGLDRFIESLDAGLLQRLSNVARQVKVVATIRTSNWEDLLNGSGQSSDTARSLANGARVIELGARGAADKPAEADRSGVVGQPTVAGGIAPVWADGWLIVYGAGLLTTLAVMLVAGVTGFAGGLLSPPSLEDQMSRITSQMVDRAGAGGGHVVLNERVRFHAGGDDSWVVAVEDTPDHDRFTNAVANCTSQSKLNCVNPAPRSDELRIYDVHGGRLSLALDFRPPGVGSAAAELDTIAGSAPGGGEYDADNAPELIGGYMWPDAANTVLPFGVYWQDGRYRAVALTPSHPPFPTQGLDPRLAVFTQQAYEHRVSLSNAINDQRFSDLKLTGFKVQTVALVQHPAARLLTGYYAAYPGDYTQAKTLELLAGQVRANLMIAPCTPTYYACRAPRLEEEVVVPPDHDLGAGLLDAWRIVGSKWRQHVRVLAVDARTHEAPGPHRTVNN